MFTSTNWTKCLSLWSCGSQKAYIEQIVSRICRSSDEGNGNDAENGPEEEPAEPSAASRALLRAAGVAVVGRAGRLGIAVAVSLGRGSEEGRLLVVGGRHRLVRGHFGCVCHRRLGVQ